MKFFKKLLLKSPKNFIVKNSRKLLIAYMIGLFPIGYVNTSLTTNIPITQSTEVLRKFAQSGGVNMATMGIQKPLANGLKYIAGSATKFAGNIVGSKDMKDLGDSIIEKSNKWFNYGKNLANKKIEEVTEIAKDKVNTSSKKEDNEIKWNAKKSPNYYEVIDTSFNEKSFIETDFSGMKKGQTKYSPLDEKGRTGEVKAIITYKMVDDSRGTREHFTKDSDPSGWGHNSKVTIKEIDSDKKYNGYFWNRSHLLADSLGGSAIRENLVTGTRMQNVGFGKGGMAYMESKLRDFFKDSTNNVVYFKATPIYLGSNDIVPYYVDLQVYSSDGSIKEKVRVYNTANNYEIDYEKGTFKEVK